MTGSFRSAFCGFQQKLPCLFVLAGIISVILLHSAFPGSVWIIPLFSVAWSLAGWYLSGPHHAFFRFALPVFAAAISLYCANYSRDHDPLTLITHNRAAVYIEAEMEITDPSLCSTAVCLPEPRKVLCKLFRIRFSADDHWHEVNSEVLANLPAGNGNLSCGDRFLSRGTLRQPEVPLFSGEFDYHHYLLRKGIHYLYYIQELRGLHKNRNACTYLLSLRDRLLASLLTYIPAEKDRALTASLLFGCRQGVEAETKQDFIRSGTIHILTVSGLHVGMFAAAVFLLLILLPLRWKMLVTPLITAVYVLMTGAQMPALRALIMLSCWCFPRAFLLSGNGLNSVFFAASLLLLWHPGQISDAGFQYSFLCVLFLVATAPIASQWISLILEKRLWLPDRQQSRADHIKYSVYFKVYSILSGCITAWLCAFILTLFYQRISVPFALPANLLIIPAAYSVFFIFTIGAVPCLLFPEAGRIFAPLLSVPLQIIDPVCEFFGKVQGTSVAVPPLWTIPAGLILLFIVFCKAGRKTGILCSCILLLFAGIWQTGMYHLKPEVVFFYGGKQDVPGIVISDPAENFSCIINSADFHTSSSMTDYLKQRGHTELSLLSVSGSTRIHTGGLQYLFPMLPVDTFLLPVKPQRSVYFKEAYARAAVSDCVINSGYGKETARYSFQVHKMNDPFEFTVREGKQRIRIKVYPRDESGTQVEILQGNRLRKTRLPNQHEPGIFRFSI